MPTPIEKYSEIQAMVQKEARDIALKVYKEEATKYGVAKTPLHYHNDVDAPKIPEDNIILTDKLQTQLVLTSSEDFTLRGVNNISRISFYGWAVNSSATPPSGVTQRALINGEVIFGRCNAFTGTGKVVTVETIKPGTAFVQSSNFIFTDTASINNTRVGSSPNLAYANDSAGTIVAQFTLLDYAKGELAFSGTVASGWQLQGIIIIE